MKAFLPFALLAVFASLTIPTQMQAQSARFFQKKSTQLHQPNQTLTEVRGNKVAARGGQDLRLTGERFEEWDGSWVPFDSSRYLYNGNQLTQTIRYEFDSSVWAAVLRMMYDYDANGNLVRQVNEEWDNGQWVAFYQTLNTYNASNQRITNLEQFWSGGMWQNSSLSTYTYDAAGNEIETVSQYWNGMAWMDSGRFLYEYNANGKILRFIYQYWDGFNWMDSYRTEYGYDANGRLVSYTDQDWTGTMWENLSRLTYSYASNNRIIQALSELWGGAAWVNDYRENNQFDANGKWTDYISYNWVNNGWQNDQKVVISEAQYDPEIDPFFGSLFHNYTGQEWDDSASVWVNSFRYFGWFEDFVGLKDIAPSFDCQVYPNPSNGTITLQVKDAGIQPERMTLCNMTGRQLMSHRLQGVENEQIQLGQLPTGQYLLHVCSKNGREAVVPVQIR